MRIPFTSGDTHFETVLSEGTEFKGNITVKGPVRVYGKVVGDIRCEDELVIGKEGEVRGNLRGRSISIGGTVVGRVEATEKAALLGTARLVGGIRAPRVAIADGAVFEGEISMGPLEEKTNGAAVKRADRPVPAQAS
jgi:cytoskeletal protein CcmA (bactofilin family)